MDPTNPLSDEHCACLDSVLQQIEQTRELVRRCRDCGLDVERAEQELEAQAQLATRLKRNFFPQRV